MSLADIHHRVSTLFPLRYRNRWVSFALVLFGAALDNINVAGSLSVYKSVLENFDTSSTTVSWTLSAYSLTLGAFILLAGKLTDIVGPKTVFVWGMFMSSLMVLICACIENVVIVLIVFRALQGMCASVMIPSMFPIAFAYFARDGMMPIAVICIMIVLTTANGVGFIVGGAFSLTDGGYKNFYFFTFAVAFTNSVVLYLTMYPVETHAKNKDIKVKHLDFPGTAMFVAGLLLIILGLTEGGSGWSKPAAYVPIPVGFIVICTALWFELIYIHRHKKSEKPGWRANIQLLVPREAFAITNLLPFICATTMLYIAYITMMITQVEYAEYIEGDNALIAGLKTIPISLGLTFGAVTGRERLIYRLGMKRVMIASQLAFIGLIGWVHGRDYTQKGNYWIYGLVPNFLIGWMINVYFGVYLNSIIRRTPGHLQGTVSGMMQTLGQVGICLGNSLVTTIMGEITVPQNEQEKSALSDKFRNCLYLAWAAESCMILALMFVHNQKEIPSKHGADSESGPEASDSV